MLYFIFVLLVDHFMLHSPLLINFNFFIVNKNLYYKEIKLFTSCSPNTQVAYYGKPKNLAKLAQTQKSTRGERERLLITVFN